LFKMMVSVYKIVPKKEGKYTKVSIFEQLFEEHNYHQVCLQAHSEENKSHFDQVPLNSLHISLGQEIARYFIVQLEFLDSYRSVHTILYQTAACPTIVVTPEFCGQQITSEGFIESIDFEHFSAHLNMFDDEHQSKIEKVGSFEYEVTSLPKKNYFYYTSLNKA